MLPASAKAKSRMTMTQGTQTRRSSLGPSRLVIGSCF